MNLQHSKAASCALCWRTSRRHVDIGLIQEPWINGGQVRGLPNKVYKTIYCDKAVSPRALIILRRGLTCLPLTEFLTRDLAAALVEVRTENIKRQLVIASGYFPGDAISPPPEEVQRLIEWCRMKKKQLILGCDANAHHKVWGSTDINHRGEDLLDFLFSTNIEIVNVGNSPTFMNAIRREVIDLTLATPFIAEMVKNWRVSEEPSMSDHMAIEFNVEATAPADVECRIPRKTDWELYIAHMSSDLKGLKYNISSNENLENASAHFTSCLKRAFENSCPLRKKTISRDVPWWNNHLENLKKIARKAFNKAKREGSWNAYRLALTNYNKEVRKAKRQSWRSFCEGIDKTAPAARLQKVLSKDHSNPIGQIKKPCGEFTNDPQKSLRALLETHFSGSRQITSEDGAPAGEVYNPTSTPPPVDKPVVIKFLSHLKTLYSAGNNSPSYTPSFSHVSARHTTSKSPLATADLSS
ncbi:uncharacterized protein LOC123670918 [Harmonia axyridis]|uniref:uncharacterized protein LOC123670918 n=1 Tax=Harmonia axyridis TaxID=115357 RepID=UPI001E27962F|nr:uncharacterized protein LOC123670918 [Harmonia axyridis]